MRVRLSPFSACIVVQKNRLSSFWIWKMARAGSLASGVFFAS
jgi:hypothetical protein